MTFFRKLYALISLTFKESFAKKTFIAFFALSTLVHLFFILALNIEVVSGALAIVKVFGQDVQLSPEIDLQEMIVGIQSVFGTAVFAGGIFLSIFATASLIPSMLEKGSIELLVSKPLSRIVIFLGRFLGALSIVIFNVGYFIVGTWLILGIKTGIWYFPYLYSILMVVIAFATMYALMALVGVTTRSAGVCIMVAFTAFFLSQFLVQREKLYSVVTGKIYHYFVDGLYHVLPKTFELGEINLALITQQPITGWSAFWTSLMAAAIIFGLATFIFARKDF